MIPPRGSVRHRYGSATGAAIPFGVHEFTTHCRMIRECHQGARAVDGGSAEQLAIDGGRSEALAQALRTVADADLGAGPKYAPPVVRDLTRTLSARAYGLPRSEERREGKEWCRTVKFRGSPNH